MSNIGIAHPNSEDEALQKGIWPPGDGTIGEGGNVDATAPTAATGTGVLVSGGDENTPEEYVADVQPDSPGFLGYTDPTDPTTPGAHVGNQGVGILRPEQSRRFIDYLFDAIVLSKEGRRVTMRANTIELDKMGVGSRVIRRAIQATNTGANEGAKFTKVELTTTKFRLDWEISTEALEDNIEGRGLEDHIVRLMTRQFGEDIEDLAINADGASGDPFLEGLDAGFIKLESGGTEATAFESTDAEGVVRNWNVNTIHNLINALPRKWRQNKGSLKINMSSDAHSELLQGLGTAGLGAFPVVERVIGGDPSQQIGPAGITYNVLGVPTGEVPLYPESTVVAGASNDVSSYASITFPQNRIWGFQRDVTLYREFQPKTDTVEYTAYVRFGVQLEEVEAVAFVSAWSGGAAPADA